MIKDYEAIKEMAGAIPQIMFGGFSAYNPMIQRAEGACFVAVAQPFEMAQELHANGYIALSAFNWFWLAGVQWRR